MKQEFKKFLFIMFLKSLLVILNALTLGIPKLISKIKVKIQQLTKELIDKKSRNN